MNNLDSFMELLDSGCCVGIYEEVDKQQIQKMLNSLKCVMNENSKKELLDRISQDSFCKNYFLEICEHWIYSLINISSKNIKIDILDNIKIVFEGTGLKKSLYVLDSENVISYFIKLLNRETMEFQNIFSKLSLYALTKYGRTSIKEDIQNLIKIGSLNENFYK